MQLFVEFSMYRLSGPRGKRNVINGGAQKSNVSSNVLPYRAIDISRPPVMLSTMKLAGLSLVVWPRLSMKSLTMVAFEMTTTVSGPNLSFGDH